MRIAVMGPGAVGCLLAGRLQEAGQDVILLDRQPARASRIAREGVRIDSRGGSRTIPVSVTADPETVGPADLLIVAVKAYDTEEAIRQWTPAIGADSVVLTLQNGLGNVEALLAEVPEAAIVGGTTGEGATLRRQGHVHHTGSGETVLAAARGGRAGAETAASPLVGAGLSVRIEDDLDAVIWSKFLTNVGVNAIAGVLGLPNGDLCKREEVRAVIRDLIAEAAEVARGKGVGLAAGDAADRAEEVLRLTAENSNSLLQDLQSGRRTEIDYLNGKVVEEGKALGIATPVNRTLWGMVRALETSGSRGES